MFRRIGILGIVLIAVAAAVSAAACGSDDDDADTTPAATSAAATSAATTAPTTAATEPAGESDIVVTGVWARNAPAMGMMTPGAGMTPMMTPGAGMTPMMTPGSMMTPGAGMTPMMTPGGMMTPGAGSRGAAYMLIENTGDEDDALIAASSAVSSTTEVHESKMEGDTVTMQEVERIDIPAGETVELKPGGFHVMFIDLKQALTVGDEIEIELTFENAGTITVTAEVRDS